MTQTSIQMTAKLIGCLVIALAFSPGCDTAQTTEENSLETPAVATGERPPTTQTELLIQAPPGFPKLPIPSSNPITIEKVALGKKLFFDKNLSSDRTVSCASCHDPERSWTNGEKYGVGVGGQEGTRSVPTLLNVAYNRSQFWDGRVLSLEAQAVMPLLSPIEMNMKDEATVLERLRENPDYEPMFASAFSDGMTLKNLAKAISCFERTILSADTPYDRYMAGDRNALSKEAKRGLRVFNGRGKCSGCHIPPLFVDFSFANLGVGMESKNPDLGRFHVIKLESSKGKFKTPTLRDIAATAPYMHDGSMKTLMETIELYDQGGIRNRYLSSEVQRPLRLSDQQKQDLLTFIVEGLSSESTSSGHKAPTN